MDFHFAYTIDWNKTSLWCCAWSFVSLAAIFVIISLFSTLSWITSGERDELMEKVEKRIVYVGCWIFSLLALISLCVHRLISDFRSEIPFEDADFTVCVPIWAMWAGGIITGLFLWLFIGSVTAVVCFRYGYLECTERDRNIGYGAVIVVWPGFFVYVMLYNSLYYSLSPFIRFVKKFVKGN